MENVTVRDDVVVAYEDNYFGPPWADDVDAVMLVHGNGESSRAWVQWIPVLAHASFRVIRPDMPGFGMSPVPATYSWTPQKLAADLVRFLDRLEISQCHLIAAKYGGTVSMQLASEFPDRLLSLCIFSSPVVLGPTFNPTTRNRDRLGSTVSEAQFRWWMEDLIGHSNRQVSEIATQAMRETDLRGQLSRITAPSLIVTTQGGKLQDVEDVRSYQTLIPNSRLEVIEGDFYHPAAVQPERCANMALEFIASTRTKSS